MNRKAERFMSKFADNCASAKLSGWAAVSDGNFCYTKFFGDEQLDLWALVAAVRSYMNALPADEQVNFPDEFANLVKQFDVKAEPCI